MRRGLQALQQPPAFPLNGVDEKFDERLEPISPLPKLMGDSQRGQFFVQTIIAAKPAIGGFGREPDMRRLTHRVDVQDGRILPAMFPAGVHLIERRPIVIKLIMIDGGVQRTDDRELFRMPKAEPQGALTAHADPRQRDRFRRQRPTRGDQRHDLGEKPVFRGLARVEARADSIGPPRPAAVRAHTSKSMALQKFGRGIILTKRPAIFIVKKNQNADRRLANRFEQIDRVTGDFNQ